MQGEQVEIDVYEPKNGDWAGNVDLDVSTVEVDAIAISPDTPTIADRIPHQEDRESRGV